MWSGPHIVKKVSMFEVLRRYRYVLKHIFYSIIKNVQKLVFHRPVKQSPAPKPTPLVSVLLGKKPKAMLWWSPRDTVPFLGNQLNRSLFTVLLYAHIKREINVYNNQTTHFICKNHREQHENGHFYHSWTRRWSGIISVVYPLKDGTYINRAKARNSGLT